MQRWHLSPSFRRRVIAISKQPALLSRSSRLQNFTPTTLSPQTARTFIPLIQDATPLSPSSTIEEAPKASKHLLHVTSPKNRTDPAAWVTLLEAALPSELRAPSEGRDAPTLTATEKLNLIKSVIVQARARVNLDPLLCLGVDQRRWDAFAWVSQILVEDAAASVQDSNAPSVPWCSAWQGSRKLDLMGEHPLRRIRYGGASLDDMDLAYSGTPLDQIASAAPSQGHCLSVEAHDTLGHLWRTLGSLVIEASDPAQPDRELQVTFALRLIAQMHRSGFIPEAVYSASGLDNLSTSHKPPLLSALSKRMLAALYDAEVTPVSGLDNGNAEPAPFTRELREHGSGVWMEFILWCCIYGQWTAQGGQILAELKRCAGRNKWSLVTSQIIASQDVQAVTHSPRPLRASSKALQQLDTSAKGSERTVSAEVAIATVEALSNALSISTSSRRRTRPAGVILDLISSIKSFLARESMGLGYSTWDAVIAQLAEAPPVYVGDNPNIMEAVLERLSETFGSELTSENAPSAFNEQHPSPAYVFRGSAVVIALYHEVLSAFIALRDLQGCRRIVRKLQSLTDTNRIKSIKDFARTLQLEQLPDGLPTGGQPDYSAKFPGISFPAFHLQIPPRILGRLLDLCTESGEFDAGRWLLRDEGIEEAIIPARTFVDTNIAPAVLRFAAAAGDATLVSHVVSVSSDELTSSVLVALCETSLRRGEWDAGRRALALLDRLPNYHGSIHDYTRYVVAMLAHLKASHVGKGSSLMFENAANMLFDMTKGKFGRLWGVDKGMLDSAVGVLASIDSQLRTLSIPLLEGSRTFTVTLPSDAFDLLLAGVAQVYGSAKARELFDIWCNDNMESRAKALPSLMVDNTTRDDANGAHSRFRILNGVLEPRISTLRTISQQALNEYAASQSTDSEPAQSETASKRSELLDWLTRILRLELGLSDDAIDYELQGYLQATAQLSTSDSHPPYYSEATLKIWRAVAPPRKAWTERTEDLLRDFASSATKRFVVTEPAQPVERHFVASLARDLNLNTAPVGEEPDVALKVTKRTKARAASVPELKVADVAGRYFRDDWRRKFPMSVR